MSNAFKITTLQGDWEMGPAVRALSQGKVLFTWGGGGGSSNGDITGRIYDSGSSKIGNEIDLIDDGTSGSGGSGKIVSLSDGGFLIPIANTEGVRRFNSDGVQIASLDITSPDALAGLPNGGYVAAFPNQDGFLSAQVYNSANRKVGAEISVADNTIGATDVFVKSDGTFSIVWTYDNQPNKYFQNFDQNGNQLSDPEKFGYPDTPLLNNLVGIPINGEIFYAWTGPSDSGTVCIYGGILNYFTVTCNAQDVSFVFISNYVAPLSDGGIKFIWSEPVFPYSSSIYTQDYDSQYNKVGSPLKISSNDKRLFI